MIYDYDPRFNRENITSESSSYRLLKDILAHKIADSMANGTASNYLSRSYGPNHRILFEAVASLLAEVMIGTLDNLDDLEFTQLRAEFVATRLMYLVFPNEDAVPVGDNHEETITFLLQTYEALLQGASKKSIDEVLNDIAEGNAVVLSTIEGYIASIKSSILATTEYNTDGVFPEHRHFAFTDEAGLGSTNKPIEYKWGDELHTHDIIDGVIQPYIDRDGNSHTHEVYLGIPENIVRLQTNLRKVFSVTKPAHIKTGEVSSIIDEDIPILAQGKGDVFSPILGIDSTKSDEQIITENTIDPTLPYYNQNAQYGLVGLSLGGLYQEEMRKAREGVYEPNNYGYVSGKTIRFWRTNIKVADTLIIGTQKLRVISVSERIIPEDGLYSFIIDDNGDKYTYRLIRDLKRGVNPNKSISRSPLEIINGCLYPEDVGPPFYRGELTRSEILHDGEPVDFNGSVYFCDLMSDNSDAKPFDPQINLGGHTIRLSYIEVTVDALVNNQGLQVVNNNSSTWTTRDQVLYETVEFINEPDPMWPALLNPYNFAINLPAYIVKDMLKSKQGLPISAFDLEVKVNGVDVDYNLHTLSLEHTNTSEDANITNPHLHVMRIYDFAHEANINYIGLANFGDTITLTYPKAKSEIRRFRELNSIEMTLNAARPTRKVSLSGRGIGQNRVIETTSPISYVLNEPQPVTPYTQEQKIATYSAGSSDLLNTKGQNLNTSYTLNDFSLNQTATQDQVFKPATKTLTTSNPQISFYELGFRPQFITSVVDSTGMSYAYTLNQDHVLVSGLTEEKTLTISGLSSNPFSADLDWYKGDKLGEGAAFYKHTSTLDLGAFTESTPEEYMTNPLGLAPDQIRSIYSMEDTQTSGIEGELTFYEDVVTEYELDGRDGFTNDYNPHDPQDELLYQDPSLYILGPRSQVEVGNPVNTIPTYLFFNYSFLNLFGGDGYYFAIYRIDSQGVKQYQTLVPRADGNGITALVEYPNLPAPNGAPLAYQFVDDGSGGGFNLNYSNGEFADNWTAEINAQFNHIPNETYYIEVYFEEDGGGADSMFFFSSGTDADHVLNTSWDTSAETYRLDDALLGGFDVTYTYEVTFATNPGEVVSFNSTPDPDPAAPKDSEEIGLTHGQETTTYYAENYYPINPLEFGFERIWKNNFLVEGMYFANFEDVIPRVLDSHYVPPMSFTTISVNSLVTITDSPIMWSLLLEPALVTETVGSITDDVFTRFNYNHIFLSDTVNFSDLLHYKLNLVKVQVTDTVPYPIDDVTVPVYQKLVPSSSYPTIGDDGFARWSSYQVSSSVNVSDEPLLASFAFVPINVEDNVPQTQDLHSSTYSFAPINESDILPSLLDEAKAWISSTQVNDLWDWPRDEGGGFLAPDWTDDDSDEVTTTYTYTPSLLSDLTGGISDTLTIPIYQTLVPSDSSTSISDSLNATLHLYLYDTVNAATDTETSMIEFLGVNESDTMITITDTLETEFALSLSTPIPAPTDSETSFISSTNQTDSTSVNISDSATAVFRVSGQYLFIGIKYNSYAYQGMDNELFSIYKGSMDTLFYPDISEYSPDSNSIDPIDVVYGDKEIVTKAILNSTAYNNTNDDANIAMVGIEYNTDYTIYAHTDYVDGTDDIAIAMKVGPKTQSPTNYLNGEGYTDLMPGSSGNPHYFLHSFYLNSTTNNLVFTADTTGTPFPFTATQSILLYMYSKYTYTDTSDTNDRFRLREAPANSNANTPDGSPAVVGGWIPPSLHDATLYGSVDSNGQHEYTNLPNMSITNTNNYAQASWTLTIGTRYHFQIEAGDHNRDFQIYLEARTQDLGASWNTEYSSSDVLDYTETLTNNDGNVYTFNHFFTIRRDGFIIWEQDKNGS